ncbi:MAG: hypothetical protein AAFP90_15405 [Planctomycetota bacterium]
MSKESTDQPQTLTRAALLRTRQREMREVQTPDGVAYVAALTESELAVWEARPLEPDGKINQQRAAQQQAALIVATLCDDKGVRMLNDSDIDSLMNVPAVITREIYDAAVDVNGLRKRQKSNAEKK